MKVRNLYKSFGEKQVLHGFSADIADNAITCIMGKSGSGKTTLLNILASLLAADRGSVEGRPDRISFMFQEDRLCDAFSAERNVRLVTGKAVDRAVIADNLRKVGILDQGPVRFFSGGMRRRVALVRTMLYDAPLVLMDEPFKGLDGETKKQAMEYVKQFDGKATILCVTHDEEEARALSARILRMEEANGGNADE